MQKKDIIEQVSTATGIEKPTVKAIIESFTNVVQRNMIAGENIYLRGFGSFVIVKRKQKRCWLIGEGKPIIVPEHNLPVFRPNKEFVKKIKQSVK